MPLLALSPRQAALAARIDLGRNLLSRRGTASRRSGWRSTANLIRIIWYVRSLAWSMKNWIWIQCSRLTPGGSLPHRPDLLLKMMLYEHQMGRPRPTQWLADLEENKAVEWLTLGIKVARSVLYEFRDRVKPFLPGLNQQVIRTAIDEKHTEASTASLDGTFVAANASRHRLLTLKTVDERLEQLDQEIAKLEAAELAEQQPQSAAVTRADEAVETGVVEAISARPETEPNRKPPATQAPSAPPTATKDPPAA
jgi:hypothetical protein